jgi:Ca2+-binding RTX toxin-like protein
MKPRIVFQLFLFGLLLLIFVSAFTAFAANVTIPDTNIGKESITVTANNLKPEACSTLYLANIVRGSGEIYGTNDNDLIIGSSGNDTIYGLGGDDCILGGDGNDSLDGGEGADVCIGGSGENTYPNCETIP